MNPRVLAFVLALTLILAPQVRADEAPTASEADPAKLPTAPKIAPTTIALAQIMIGFKSDGPVEPSVTRSHDEAKALAAEVVKQARAKNADFGALAKKFSDDKASSQLSGGLGRIERGSLPPPIEAVAFGMEVGQVSDPVESKHGFQIFLRQDELAAAHIVVMYKGSELAGPEITRTREEARARALAVLAKIKAGAKLADLAPTDSDCPSKRMGGNLGVFAPGQKPPGLEKAVCALKVGEMSEVVETSLGFHIIQRLPAPVVPFTPAGPDAAGTGKH